MGGVKRRREEGKAVLFGIIRFSDELIMLVSIPGTAV